MKNVEDFKSIYETYKKFSAKVVFRMVKNTAVAEDISQEVMVKLFQIRDSVDITNEKKLRSFVFTMSVNKTKDYFKKAQVKREVNFLDVDVREESRSLEGDPLDTLLKMEKTEYQKLILERLKQKKPDHYDILIKVKVYDIPPASVAEEYGISVNVVNNRILRAKRWLMKELSKIYET